MFRLSAYRLSHFEKTNMEIGIKQLKRGDFFDAGLRFRFVLLINKQNAIAHYLLGKSYFYRGKFSKAIPHLRQALKLRADLTESEFLLACCGVNPQITSIPRSFIIEKLDYISTFYDEFTTNTSSLVNKVLEEELKKIIGENMGFNVLDLGCRGGDTAEILRKVANAVVGVDPSLKMVALARNRRIENMLTFNLLITKFPEDYLAECKDKFSVVTSTYYIDNLGPLENYFSLVAKVLEPGGLFAFNTNKSSGSEDFSFRSNIILFSHSAEYIKKLADSVGFNIIIKREIKYPNNTEDLVYILEKK